MLAVLLPHHCQAYCCTLSGHCHFCHTYCCAHCLSLCCPFLCLCHAHCCTLCQPFSCLCQAYSCTSTMLIVASSARRCWAAKPIVPSAGHSGASAIAIVAPSARSGASVMPIVASSAGHCGAATCRWCILVQVYVVQCRRHPLAYCVFGSPPCWHVVVKCRPPHPHRP